MRSMATQTPGASFPVWWLERGVGGEEEIASEVSRTEALPDATHAPTASMRPSWVPMTRRSGRRNDNLHPRYEHHHRWSQTRRCCEAIGLPGGEPVHYRLINTSLDQDEHACEWKIDTKSLRSNKPALIKPYRSAFGDFLLCIRAKQSSNQKGGRSIGAAGGRGYIEVKRLSAGRGLAVRLLSVTVGGVRRTVAHDFDLQGLWCRVEGLWSFGEVAENSRDGSAVLIFRFGIAAVRPNSVQDGD